MDIPPVYVVSGSVGASGRQVVSSVLAQFPGCLVPVEIVAHVRQPDQVRAVVDKAAASGGIIVLTMVDEELGKEIAARAAGAGVRTIDLMGDLLGWLAHATGREPAGRPGLYRELEKDYFERIVAIEYSMTHDDGRSPAGWPAAEIVLVGVSRAGKTPLTMYLAVLGWRVANVPLVPGIPLPKELDRVDRRRILALDIEPDRLSVHRGHRQRELGVTGRMDYSDEDAVWQEVDAARQEIRRRGYGRIDVTDKPVETLADEVIRTITRRLGASARR
ncbi:MAG: pyruvate, water dikinase regulatory protein [Planctomycetota bacterium]